MARQPERDLSRIPRHVIDEVRERTDLVELVERHVRLQRRGNSHVGLCPFHQEKSPSFHVVPHKRLYHCFGCGVGGDCFKFLMELEGVSFLEAVKELAGPAGVTIEEREMSDDERRALRMRASLYDVMDATSTFWEGILMTRPEGAAAREYLKGRGITAETARHWRIGYAPGGWTTTMDWLQRKGYPMGLLSEAGLAKPGKRDGHYDTFRDRITIPITDERGRILAFGARLMQGEGPKYLNSPETPLYRKSRVLFGLQHARQAIQRKGRAMVVEGYFDVISMHQAGFAEAIATCGTALTVEHLETLRRLAEHVVALFDADEAGARAAEKSLPMFFDAGVLPWRLEIPGAKDPDELVREEGPQAMETALEQRQPLLEWVVERRLSRSGGGAASRDALVGDVVDLLALTEGTDIVARAAARLRIRPEVLQDKVDQARRTVDRRRVQATRRDPMQDMTPPPADEPPPPDVPSDMDLDAPPWDEPPAEPVAPPWRPTRDVVHLLWLLVHRPEQTRWLAEGLAPLPWLDQGPAAAVLEQLTAGVDVASLLESVDEAGVRRTLMAVVARQSLYTAEQAEGGMAQVLHRLVVARVDAVLSELAPRIHAAVQRNDWALQGTLTQQQLALRKARSAMQTTLKKGELQDWLTQASAIMEGSSRNTGVQPLSTSFTSG